MAAKNVSGFTVIVTFMPGVTLKNVKPGGGVTVHVPKELVESKN